ncbi:unnamed protein product, partial [Rotaria magnacalcarata]
MAEQLWKDLPKHMKNFGEKVVVAGRDVIDHFRAMKAEIDRRVQKLRSKKGDTSTPGRTTTT